MNTGQSAFSQKSSATPTQFSSVAYLVPHDGFMNLKGTAGQLVLSTDHTLTFTPTDKTQPITIKLADITVADFTNIFAKVQFKLTTQSGIVHIFNFADPFLHNLYKMTKNVKLAQKWKDVLISQLPATVVRQRKEVQVKNLVIGILIGVAVLAAICVSIIVFGSR